MVENGCYGPRKLLVPVAPDHSASRLSSRGNKRARDSEAVTSVASCWSLIEVLMRRQTFLAFVGATAASARPPHAQPQPRFEGMPNRLLGAQPGQGTSRSWCFTADREKLP